MLNTIFLIGYMGAGKSVIGKSLSKNNGFNFYDLDKYIEEKLEEVLFVPLLKGVVS